MTTRERYMWATGALGLAAVCFFTGLPVVGGILALWASVWIVCTYGDSQL